jgi:hypothetical protein
MPNSKQRPLEAPRGGHEHDFSLGIVAYEAAVFDRASHFNVVRLRLERGSADFLRNFADFAEAVRYAAGHADACVYAVTESGRHCLLDRERLAEWETRWRQGR